MLGNSHKALKERCKEWAVRRQKEGFADTAIAAMLQEQVGDRIASEVAREIDEEQDAFFRLPNAEDMRSDVCHARLVVRLGTKTRAKIDVAVASDDYRASVLRRRRPLR